MAVHAVMCCWLSPQRTCPCDGHGNGNKARTCASACGQSGCHSVIQTPTKVRGSSEKYLGWGSLGSWAVTGLTTWMGFSSCGAWVGGLFTQALSSLSLVLARSGWYGGNPCFQLHPPLRAMSCYSTCLGLSQYFSYPG